MLKKFISLSMSVSCVQSLPFRIHLLTGSMVCYLIGYTVNIVCWDHIYFHIRISCRNHSNLKIESIFKVPQSTVPIMFILRDLFCILSCCICIYVCIYKWIGYYLAIGYIYLNEVVNYNKKWMWTIYKFNYYK